ncbi:amino acid permease [Rhodococcus koreensis]
MTVSTHHKKLATRHITMISIGGVIGATLFIGSGTVINNTGPAAILSYVLGGIVVVLAMRMLGEMAAVQPARGSFSTYARQAFGPWAGFTIGWLYWAVWAITIAYEASLLGFMLNGWVPQIPIWLGALALLLLMALTNVFSVRMYGNAEYVLSLIKVLAIIGFLIVGVLLLTGVITARGATPGVHNITEHGGFFPLGVSAVFVSLVLVTFSLGGTEVAAIAASESENPTRNVVRAINSVLFRIMLFFVGSVSILVLVIPWDDSASLTNPYVSVFKIAGLGAAENLMSAVVFVSIMSVMNSGIYTASRMLTSLAGKAEAPRALATLSRRGTPVAAIAACVGVAYALTLVNISSLATLFTFLANCTGGVLILVYIFIAASHIRLRKRRGDDALAMKMWLFPGLSYLFILGCLALYLSQIFIDSLRTQFFCTTGFLAVVLVSYLLRAKLRRGKPDPAEPGTDEGTDPPPATGDGSHLDIDPPLPSSRNTKEHA